MWEVHCTDNDPYFHKSNGNWSCSRTDCTKKDHNVVTHWTLLERTDAGVEYLHDTSRPDKVAWLEDIARRLNASV